MDFINDIAEVFNSEYQYLLSYVNTDWVQQTKKFAFRVVRSDSDILYVDFGVNDEKQSYNQRVLLRLALSKYNAGTLFCHNRFLNGAEITIVNRLLAALGLGKMLKTFKGTLKYRQMGKYWLNVGAMAAIATRNAGGIYGNIE